MIRFKLFVLHFHLKCYKVLHMRMVDELVQKDYQKNKISDKYIKIFNLKSDHKLSNPILFHFKNTNFSVVCSVPLITKIKYGIIMK